MAVCAGAYNLLNNNNHNQLMCGDWIMGPLLGEGTYGRVYKATLRSSLIAVKTEKTSLSQTLRKEFQILARLYDCPHVIRCLGYHTTQDYEGRLVSNLLLEYASGGSLLDRIQKSGGFGLPEMEVRAHTKSILRGLRHIHGLGFVHCDLKPENVLLVAENGNFTAKISDFGLSKERGTVPYASGTRAYLSPEAELLGRQEEASDVWALGCVVLEMLVGRENAWGGEKEEILGRIGGEMISEDARDFVKCCFTSDPDQRPTADSLLPHSFVDDYAKRLFSSANASVEDAEYGFREGTYGRVYKATLRSSFIAVKTEKTSLSQTLRKEFQILARLYDCPHVIRCLGYHTTQDYEGRSVSNLLLEYASGGSLLDRIQKSGGFGLPEMEVRAHTKSILRGLRHIHGLGFVHCDLKPENVLLVAENGNFTAKISDFGLSKERGTVPYASGTRAYLSPEAELLGKQEEASDVWALGCVVLEMLVGRENAWGGAKEEILGRIGREMISEDARDFVKCCFTSDPDRRPTADSLLLHSFVDDYAKRLFSSTNASLMCGGKENEYGDWIRGPLLGEGTYGRVYKATLRSSFIAVKTEKKSLTQTLRKEFQILARLYDCPHVIRCLGYHTTQEYYAGRLSVSNNLLLEYASGGSLLDRIQKSGGFGLPEMEVRAHTKSILRGLRHIHGLGFVHCDLKPENVLLVAENGNFTAKISDFGLSKERGTVPYASGTRAYLSPEAELLGKQEEASDVWALGCVVLEMLVGRENAWGGAKEEILGRIGREMISEDARDFVKCCFTSDADQRPTADSLLLHSFVDDYAKRLFSSANASVEDAEY
ncbi:mitogen-activated protein kinase kinase kinase, partial [Striga asiatica]